MNDVYSRIRVTSMEEQDIIKRPKQGTRRCMRPGGATIHPLHILLSHIELLPQASSCSIISARYIRRRFCNTSRITSCDAWGVGYEHTKVRRTNKLWMMCIVGYVAPRWRNRPSFWPITQLVLTERAKEVRSSLRDLHVLKCVTLIAMIHTARIHSKDTRNQTTESENE
jgi:hypothetical protein